MKAFSGFLISWVVLLSLGLARPARADWDGALPTDFGSVSVDASRRELMARLQDWEDDRAEFKPRRVFSCAMAGLEGYVISGGSATFATLKLLRELPGYFGDRPGAAGPSALLRASLRELSQKVTLTSGERQALARLSAREVVDTTDRLRLAIDTQALLMKVATRLYQEQIDHHLKKARGILGIFPSYGDQCRAFSLQIERDTQLLLAGRRILALYDFLEQELDN